MDLQYFEYLQTLDSMSFSINDKIVDMIKLFNEYVSSNQYFKYNKTYLNDSIAGFLVNCDVFINKKKIYNQFLQEIKHNYKSIKDWVFIFDHIYVLDDLGLDLLAKRIEKMENTNDMNLSKLEIMKQELQQFSLYAMDKNNIIIRYYNDQQSPVDFTEKRQISKGLVINSLVANTLEKRSEKNE